MITTARGRNRNYLLMDGDTQVGEVWKMQGAPGFGVKLNGIYWRNGEPNTRGGSTTTGVRRLMDAAPLAERVLTPNGRATRPDHPLTEGTAGLEANP